MQATETTGKSVAEATEAAAAKLGVSASELEVTVLEETKGLFGKSTIRIRAEIKGGAPAPAPIETPAAPAEPEAKASRPAPRGRGKKAEEVAPEVVAEPEPAVQPEAPKGGSRRGKKAPAATEVAPSEAPAEASEPVVEAVATAADGDQIVALVRDLMAKADLAVTVNATDLSGRYVTVELDGKDAAYLVGKQGEVLNATQYLINIIAGRRFNNGVRATLDGNNYRQRREAKLEMMATELAKQVKARGEEAVLDALPAFERRIVHKVLSTVEGISTYSEGEEPNRRVVIAPND
jgi:spoIIIJ-associated protein